MNVVFTNHVADALEKFVGELKPFSVHVLVDVNTEAFVLPVISRMSPTVADAGIIRIKAGEMYKNIDSLQSIWKQLEEQDANRRSLLINLGGGVVTDMGSFAGACYKRGISFVNIPTTLLGAVDASVGGKTGINFNGLKNEIGAFRDADLVIVSTLFFNTLTNQELLSGYGEMLKHGFISSDKLIHKLLGYDVTRYNPDTLLGLLEESVAVKAHYVENDHEDHGARRALNFGHTFGHAFESMALQRKTPLSHGYAVAFGMIPALVLSHMILGFPSEMLHTYAAYVREHYGAFEFSCDDYPRLLSLMHHDKKNVNSTDINFTLLKAIGEPQWNVTANADQITAALDIYRDLLQLP